MQGITDLLGLGMLGDSNRVLTYSLGITDMGVLTNMLSMLISFMGQFLEGLSRYGIDPLMGLGGMATLYQAPTAAELYLGRELPKLL